MGESAQARVLEVYGPFHARPGSLFADYGPDEIAVLTDRFTRARSAMRESFDEIRGGTDGSGT